MGILSAVLAAAASAQPVRSEADINKAVDALVSQMTLDEKLAQMSQNHFGVEGKGIELNRKDVRNGLGSLLNARGIANTNALQKIALEESRLKIPLLFGLDVIHGYRTVFPIPLGQSCSWDPALVQAAARVAAVEASAEGIRWTFAPMVDLTHDPRWGRIAESCGEDPYLTSQFAVAMVRGFQGENLNDPQSIAACAKHYVGYGAVEGGRDYNTTLIPEGELRNIHLPSFKAARENGVLTFMSAFTDINGIPASGNVHTLRDILKNEWQFDGFVVSDWNSIREMENHGVAGTDEDAARLAVLGGVDMEMVSTTYRDHVKELVQRGIVPVELLDDSVRRILRVKYRLGLFDHPYTEKSAESVLLTPHNQKVAHDLALESIVLLKNEGILPLSSQNVKSIALIGPLADRPSDMRGCWAGAGLDSDTETLRSVLKNYLPEGAKINYAPGLTLDLSKDRSGFVQAVTAAKASDVVVMALGEGAGLSGEARSRAHLDLPGIQEQLLDEIAATGKPIVLVLFAGRPMTFAHSASQAKAVMYAWHPGIRGASALCDLIFGRAVPTGKLTTSFPRTIGQIPVYYNRKNTGRPVKKGDEESPLDRPATTQGDTSRYFDVGFDPAYPFGYGLSYTTFTYSHFSVSDPTADGLIKAQVTVANTGKRDGVEVVQWYTHQRVATNSPRVRELKSFERVPLKAGEQRVVTLTLQRTSLGFYNQDGHYVIEPGKFDLWVGSDSTATLGGEFTLRPQ